MQLTADQQRVVQFNEPKNLLVSAGAGAGKTQVLAMRVAHLLNKIPASEIALVTFSRAADVELRNRVERLAPASARHSIGNMQISTIDAFFSQMVDLLFPIWWQSIPEAQRTHHQPSAPIPILIDEQDALDDIELNQSFLEFVTQGSMENSELPTALARIDFLLSGAIVQSRFNNTRQNLLKACLLESMLSALSPPCVIASQWVHPEAQALLESLQNIAKSHFYRRMQRGHFTYADRALFLHTCLCVPLLLKAGTPFQDAPHSIEGLKLQELIIDEYQDTSLLQHQILSRIAELCSAERPCRMVVVGDPKQSIYRFRGANVEVFHRLQKDEVNWSTVYLDTNFRSQPKLLTEINLLSEIALNQNPKSTSSKFDVTEFHQYAMGTRAQSRSLQAGKIDTADSQTAVTFLSASLNPKRGARPEHKGTLQDLIWVALAKHVKQFPLHECVILTETNTLVQNITKAFENFGIPVKYGQKNQDIGTQLTILKCCFQDLTKLEWFKVLADPQCIVPNVPTIMQEKVFLVPHTEIVSQAQSIAKFNPLAAWALLRTTFFGPEIWHDFYSALSSKLQRSRDPSEWKYLKNIQLAKPVDSHNGIEVITVHAAKGLEWKHVFFAPSGTKSNRSEPFLMLPSQERMFLKWAFERGDSLCAQIKNDKVTSDVDNDGEKPIWFIDLQNKFESEFERARVFYTAFTRASETLTIVTPTVTSVTKSPLRDKISEKVEDGRSSAELFESFEDRVVATYLEKRFALRRPPRGNPIEPWVNDIAPLRSTLGSVMLCDYGPAANIYFDNDDELP